ncbi:MAG: preprotein translocase subunit SecG [Rhodospirillales bacterium]|nr:preprotein translocase subunit SecG [Rhodospirillales bacterium]
MTTVILVIHLLLAVGLVGIILIQRSEGGGLGIGGSGGGGGGMGGFMTGRAAADLLTRTTAIIAAAFMVTSLTLAILASGDREQGSILDKPQPASTAPAKPSEPSVPLAK